MSLGRVNRLVWEVAIDAVGGLVGRQSIPSPGGGRGEVLTRGSVIAPVANCGGE